MRQPIYNGGAALRSTPGLAEAEHTAEFRQEAWRILPGRGAARGNRCSGIQRKQYLLTEQPSAGRGAGKPSEALLEAV